MNTNGCWGRAAWYVSALLWILNAPPTMAARPEAEVAAQPVELVRTAVANELQSLKGMDRFTWLDRVQKPSGSVTKKMVEASEGLIARTIALNDKPLTPEQRRREDERLKLLLDSDHMREKARRQRDDRQRLERLFQVLPDALTYQYSASEKTASGHRIVKLEFQPNPRFTPPSYDTQLYRGMQGQVWIDTTVMRIVRLDGTLFKDVTFGLGIVGRLDKGGHILLEQEEVTKGHWDVTRMQLTINGRILLFKQLHIDMVETIWGFRPVPAMSVQQAIELLHNSER
ncbi:MAG: hypothetical protein ABSD88_12910 [Candidatus Korobacteraceae bacterium]